MLGDNENVDTVCESVPLSDNDSEPVTEREHEMDREYVTVAEKEPETVEDIVGEENDSDGVLLRGERVGVCEKVVDFVLVNEYEKVSVTICDCVGE
jgi:hypothetical protein